MAFQKQAIFFIASIFVFLIHSTSFAQENYIAGSIINQAGDTIKGLLDYRNWNINPDKISFKANAESAPRIYTPSDIRGFLVADDLYRSAPVEIETSTYKTKELEYGAQFKLESRRLFLRALFTGNKELYLYHGPNDLELFYIHQDTSFTLLLHKKYLKEQAGSSVVAHNQKYLGQLAGYLQDCSSIQSKLKTTAYNQSSLEKLFQQYYICKGTTITKEEKNERMKVELGLVAGASLTSLKFSGIAFPYLERISYSRSLNFEGGISINLVAPRNYGKWSIYNELLYGSYHVKGSFNDYESQYKYTIYNTEFGYSFIKLNNLVRYKHPIGDAFIFINGGISNAIGFSGTNYKQTISVLYSSSRTEEEEAIAGGTRRTEFGFLFGIGTQWKKFSLELRGERGNGVSQILQLSSHTTKFHLLLNYRLH